MTEPIDLSRAAPGSRWRTRGGEVVEVERVYADGAMLRTKSGITYRVNHKGEWLLAPSVWDVIAPAGEGE